MSRAYGSFLVLLLLTLPAGAQVMTCTNSGSGDCHFVHYHVQSYNDRTRQEVELYGTNRFSTTEACEAERNRRMAAEKQAVAFVRQRAPRARVQESKFGPCHCDMTSDPSNRAYLPDDRRFDQMHLQRDITLQLLEEAYDKGLETDSAIAEGLASRPTSFAASLWPNVAEIPPDSPDRFLEPTAPPLKPTQVSASKAQQIDTSRYELVEVAFGEEVPLETVIVESDMGRIDPTAEFVNAESATIQGYVPDILTLPEGTQKDQLLELVRQRGQLLSNLSRLVQTAGASSPLGTSITSAGSPEERAEVIGRIFGETVREHWAPDDPTALLIEIPDAVATDPVAVLRDPGDRFAMETRQMALYVFLMRTGALTENQEIWLSGLIETMLESDQ